MSSPSLSPSLLFLQPVNIASAFSFCRLPFVGSQHVPRVEEAQLKKIVCLKPLPETTNGRAPAGRRSSHLPQRFLAFSSVVRPLFLVRPPILEREFNGLQNYTPLLVESSPLRSKLLFTSYFLWLVSANLSHIVRWDPTKRDVLFITFRLVYILAMFWECSEITLYGIELSV